MATVAALQLCAEGDVEHNLQRAGILIQQAAEAGAELLVLPENFAYYNTRDLQAAAQSESGVQAEQQGPVRHFLAEQAKQYRVWILAGTLPLFLSQPNNSPSTRPYAASLLFNAEGDEVARYHKMHLFDVTVAATGKSYKESDSYCHGDTPVTVNTPLGKLGLSVCYDLRFPELYRAYAEIGVDVVAVPSAFTSATGEVHWRLLLQARAVENQCYVIGANLGHRDHPKKPTWGGSAIIDPWGKVLAELEAGEGFISAEIDAVRLAEIRANMPVLKHRQM